MARPHFLMAGILLCSAIPNAPAAAEPKPFSRAPTVDDGKLAGVTGKADVRILQETTTTHNVSTVSGNIINGDPTSGGISFDGGAFGGFNGLALLSANTGNNVAINSTMTVNVAFQQ